MFTCVKICFYVFVVACKSVYVKSEVKSLREGGGSCGLISNLTPEGGQN